MCIYRIYGYSFVFFIVFFGNVLMLGFVVIIYFDSVGYVIIGNRIMLFYWNLGLFVMELIDIIFSFRI